MSAKSIPERSKVVRYDHNPFVKDMSIPVRGKQVRLSRMGTDDHVLLNQETGEFSGTHVATFKRVDAEQFIKIFTQNIALTFDLNAAGIKAFNVLLWVLQSRAIERDLVPLDKIVLHDFLESHKPRKPPMKMSQPTFWRGLAELEKAQIIAKHIRKGWYYINPNFCFNGDRIAFTNVIERKSPTEEDQQSLPLE